MEGREMLADGHSQTSPCLVPLTCGSHSSPGLVCHCHCHCHSLHGAEHRSEKYFWSL